MISDLANALIQGYAGHTSGPNGTVTRVVIHATVSPCIKGGARNNAHYFQSASSGGLAHYVVDPFEIIACCDEDVSCHHAPPNQGSIGIELCDPQTGDQWGDADHQKMLTLAAKLTADICARHQIPLVWRPPDQLRAGNWGITSHANVAEAWHKTDHTDPGPYFPTDRFMALVAGNVDELQPDERLWLKNASDKATAAYEQSSWLAGADPTKNPPTPSGHGVPHIEKLVLAICAKLGIDPSKV